ncbi:class I SAM-dependent methyltransferase [Vibrio atypicus]|uniref:class I SAM-dependent methyltransferase n=1 Tax=Vibrio atypicus TaxID=558271 RepID=UPI00135CACC9|nr:class I SAM-dependent methyltransferase [Vibrio atypicus]
MSKKIDFDQYSDEYENILEKQLNFFSSDRNFFSKHKANIVSCLVSRPKSILDFGCGVGLNLPSLINEFPFSDIFASDTSIKSLELAKNIPGVTVIGNSDLDEFTFDLIFLSGVIHHVELNERKHLLVRLEKLLSPGGNIVIFEHNPFNPMTRYLVSTCPFDEDAVLLSLSMMNQLFGSSTGLEFIEHGYCLLFPPKLRMLVKYEPLFKHFPLGGQYYVHYRKV